MHDAQHPELSLEGRVALVTGASRGTGHATARALGGRFELAPIAATPPPDAVADAVVSALTRPPEAAVHNIILDRN